MVRGLAYEYVFLLFCQFHQKSNKGDNNLSSISRISKSSNRENHPLQTTHALLHLLNRPLTLPKNCALPTQGFQDFKAETSKLMGGWGALGSSLTHPPSHCPTVSTPLTFLCRRSDAWQQKLFPVFEPRPIFEEKEGEGEGGGGRSFVHDVTTQRDEVVQA